MDSIILIDTLDTDFFGDTAHGLDWIGGDARHYDPLDGDIDLEGTCSDDDDALIDEGDLF